MDLWATLKSLDVASSAVYEALRYYTLEELSSEATIGAIAAPSVYPQLPEQGPSLHLRHAEWNPLTNPNDEPIAWRLLVPHFRRLVHELLTPLATPAYSALLLDLKSTLHLTASAAPIFTFAALDAQPAEASTVIDDYLRNGIPSTNVLFSIPPGDRLPLVIHWTENSENSETDFTWPDTSHYVLNFIGHPESNRFRADFSQIPAPLAVALRRTLEDDDLSEQCLLRYRCTIKGYLTHIAHHRRALSKLDLGCSRLFGVFVPVSATPATKAAILVLFDLTDGVPKSWNGVAIRTLLLARCLEGYFNNWQTLRLKELEAERAQRSTFAHHTSAIIDSIVEDIRFLPANTRESMGGYLLARLHLLRATISSYRSHASRVDVGDFDYPWQRDECPMKVYSEIGLQLGLARAQDGPKDEENVREFGSLLHEPGYEPGGQKFLALKTRLFEGVPETSSTARPMLRHSSFAVLILLAIKQAVYHTIRAQCRGSKARVLLEVFRRDDDLVFSCTIRNPEVASDSEREVKDVLELKDLAYRLSNVGRHQYDVDGPRRDSATSSWITTVEIRSHCPK